MTTNEPLKNIFVWCIINLINSVKLGELSAIFCLFFFFVCFICFFFFYNLLKMIILSHFFLSRLPRIMLWYIPLTSPLLESINLKSLSTIAKSGKKMYPVKKNLLLHLNLFQNLSQHFLLYSLSMCM